MSANTVIDTKSMVFSRLYYTGKFEVPWHQRRYDWKKEHVSELLHDIDEAVSENRRCYFLGAVMLLAKQGGSWQINDGQQRMVTISLICAYLCRLFSEANDSRRETIALRLLFDLDENSTEQFCNADRLTPRLTPPRDDKTRYNQLIRGKNIGSNGKLTLAWQEIDSFVAGMGVEKARSFFDFLIQKVEVACLYIPTDVDPNSIYETINSRGKPLDDLDLIRNYLYSYFNDESEKARRDTVNESLERVRVQLRDDTKITDYARCYFQCRYGFLPKGSLYRETRKKIRVDAENKSSGERKPADYVYDLVDDFSRKEYVELFRVISTPSLGDPFINQFHTHSNKTTAVRNLFIFLKELQTYTVTQSIVFALLSHYVNESDGRKQRKLAKFIHGRMKQFTSFVMRTAFVSLKFEPSQFEDEFANQAEMIQSRLSDDGTIFDEFLRECDTGYGILNDDKFVERMKIQEMRDAKKIKRFLLGLNYALQSDSEVINEYRCSVEHILPKAEKHRPTWKGFEGHNPSDWIHRIGNLTLLGQYDNKPGDSENRNFLRKKAGYGRSAIALTRALDQYTEWSPGEVNARQMKLVQHAVRVWSF